MEKEDFDFIFAYQEELNCKLFTSKHRIVAFLSKQGYKILYIEVPKFILVWIYEKIKSLFFKRIIIPEEFNSKNIYILKPFTIIPTKFLFDNLIFSKIESYIVKLYIKIKLKSPISCRYFQIYIPKSIELLFNKTINSKKVIYHLIDDFRYLKRAPKVISTYHNIVSSSSPKIITPSKKLYDQIINKNKFFLPHGYVNYEFDTQNYNFKNLLSNKLNNIIYYGQLNKLNYQLIIDVVSELPEFNFIFIGINHKIQKIKLENLNFIDYLDHKKLMYLLKHSQLLWCPFNKNNLSFAMTPIKYIEALSFGIPVLSTHINYKDSLTNELIVFKDNYLEHVNFIRTFQKFENPDKKAGRIEAVKDRTWDVIINKYIEFIEM